MFKEGVCTFYSNSDIHSDMLLDTVMIQQNGAKLF